MRLFPQRAISASMIVAGALLCAPAWAAADSFAALATPEAALDGAATLPVPTLAATGAADSASWSTTAGTAPAGHTFTAPVQGLAEGDLPKAWYDATLPVPEPNTYALMLAGLGVIGLVARRRRPR